MTTLGNTTNFKYLEVVEVQGCDYEGQIRGKLKDADVYLINFQNGAYEYGQLFRRFGALNRHLELAWGAFKNNANEFLVPATIIKRK